MFFMRYHDCQKNSSCVFFAVAEIAGMLPLVFTDAEQVATHDEVYAATVHSLACSSTKHRHAGCELVHSAALSDSAPSIPYEDQAILSSTTWKRVLHVLTAVSNSWEDARNILAITPETVCIQAVSALTASVKAIRDVLSQASRSELSPACLLRVVSLEYHPSHLLLLT